MRFVSRGGVRMDVRRVGMMMCRVGMMMCRGHHQFFDHRGVAGIIASVASTLAVTEMEEVFHAHHSAFQLVHRFVDAIELGTVAAALALANRGTGAAARLTAATGCRDIGRQQ